MPRPGWASHLAALGICLCLVHTTGNVDRTSLAEKDGTRKQYRLTTNNDRFRTPWLSGLPAMSAADHAPTGRAWKNNVAICSTMKDENVTDVREWLQYHRWLGVEHIFLTDNGSQDADHMLAALSHEFPASFLTLSSDPRPKAQLPVFAKCIEEERSNFNWMGFFDVDEFLVVRNSQKKGLADFLDAYKHEVGIAVHWVWVGPSGRRRRPASGGVLPYYTLCSDQPSTHLKTIANMWFIEGMDVHPHNFRFRDGRTVVNENMVSYPMTWKATPVAKRMGTRDSDCKKMSSDERSSKCFLIATATASQDIASVNKIGLFHYATKSIQDFSAKMKRGSGMSNARKGMAYFEEIARMQTHAPLCGEPAAAANNCCSFLY